MGIHPTLTHVPPKPHLVLAGDSSTKSTTITLSPYLAASKAVAKPPEPPPITARSNYYWYFLGSIFILMELLARYATEEISEFLTKVANVFFNPRGGNFDLILFINIIISRWVNSRKILILIEIKQLKKTINNNIL